MSRIGKKPIELTSGIEARFENKRLEIKGPKGSLSLGLHSEVELEVKEGEIFVKKIGKSKKSPAIWGLTRALINNMVKGVRDGYEKKLELQGVGYRMAIQGKQINLTLGFSHPVEVAIPEGLEAKIIENNALLISGIDKQLVGQFAANIRKLKPVEPYKGKGFRYSGEYVRRKAGKKAATEK
jgi:large subunit ribosomal protein L6